MLFLIAIAHAGGGSSMNASEFALKIARVVGNPILIFLGAAALLVFLWGVAEYIRGSDSESARATGQQHMLWGLVGLFIMVSAYTILEVLTKSIYG